MKIGQVLLQERCGLIQPKFAKHIDLSHCNLVRIDTIKQCATLQTLILRYNSLSIVPKVIASLPELWKLDLSHNMVSSLEGLLNMRCLGSLILSFNNLCWSELRKIQHIIILDLRLLGNPGLEKDAFYRRHVIDCLPNVWMLDGVLVTSAERDQVARFFRNSEVLERPVRRKLRPLTASKFIPSHIQKLSSKAVLGKNGIQLLSRFSQQEKHTLRTDLRRIRFMAQMYENDLAVQRSYWSLMSRSGCMPPDTSSPLPAYMSPQHHIKPTTMDEGANELVLVGEDGEEAEGDPPAGLGLVPPLVRLLNGRQEEVERCNMLLLLLVAGLEYSLPVNLVLETLHTANLAHIGGVDCSALLQLPQEELLLTCSILLGSVIIDRGEKEEGGLYRRLFVSLYMILSNLFRGTHGYPDQYQLRFMSPAVHRALLAAEVVQLMCLVPSFLDLLERDQGVLDVVAIATQNPHIKDALQDLLWNVTDFDEVNAAILHMVRRCIEDTNYEMLELEPGLVPYTTPLSAVAIQTTKNIHQRAKSAVAARRKRYQSGHERVPKLGDMVTLPRQRKGRVVGLHQDQLALIQISNLPVTSSREACGEYVYVDMQFMGWDNVAGIWKQQLHVQEYPSETRVTRKVEKCYSVISNGDYNYRSREQDNRPDTAASEIGDAYHVHERRSLQLELDDEGSKYMSQRPHIPSTPGLSDGVFASEEEVQVRLNPTREAAPESSPPQREAAPEGPQREVVVTEAVPVMRQVLEHATNLNIAKQELEMRENRGHVSQVEVHPVRPTTATSRPKTASSRHSGASSIQLLLKHPNTPASGLGRCFSEVTDPDITLPSSQIRIIPVRPVLELNGGNGYNCRLSKVSTIRSLDSPIRKSRNSPCRSPDLRKTQSVQGPAWATSSLGRPVHGFRSSTPHTPEELITQQKSLPDVSGISLFAYSMGRVGFIKPPDITDQLATARSKETKKNRFGYVGSRPKGK